MCPFQESAGQGGGVNIPGAVGFIAGSIVGRDQINNYGPTVEGSLLFWRQEDSSGQPKRLASNGR